MRRNPIKLFARISAVVVLGVVLFGCDNSNKLEPTLSSLWDNELQSCGVNCHSPDAADGTEIGPDLSTKDKFHSNLVGKSVNNNYLDWAAVKTGDCNDVNFITPGDAAQSTVPASLILSYADGLAAATGCTPSYNLHEVAKVTINDQEVVDALVDWINAGAQNN